MARQILILLCLLCGSVIVPERILAVTVPMTELIQGAPFPETLRLKDLDGTWLKAYLIPQKQMSVVQLISMFTMFMDNGQQFPGTAYYTKWDYVTCGDETYLVAYRKPEGIFSANELEYLATAGEERHSRLRTRYTADNAQFVTDETVLTMVLINTRKIGSLHALRAFNRQDEILSPEASARMLADRSLSNLKQLALAALIYSQEHDEIFPRGMAALDVSDTLLVVPGTEERYVMNAGLAGKALGEIKEPEKTVCFYEPNARGDGMRGVAFVDGHAALVDAQQWLECKNASGIE